MESLFYNRGPNVTVKLRNNHDSYLAASNDEKSITLVSPAIPGYTPKNAEWIIQLHSITSEFTEFSLQSIYGKELAGQKGENGKIVFCQKKSHSSRPWRSDNDQTLSGGIYLFCDCETRDGVTDLHKLSATQDGTVLAKPSFIDTLEDPGSWWFIEVVEKITPESGTISAQPSETRTTSSVLQQPPVAQHQFADTNQLHGVNSPYDDQGTIRTGYSWSTPGSSYQYHIGLNTNGAGNQNVGNVKIKNKFSVKPSHGMIPYYNHDGSYFGEIPQELQYAQPPYNPEHHLGSYVPSNLGSSSTSYAGHNLDNSTRETSSMRPISGTPGISTYISTGNNINGSGTQTNNVSIENKGPIYKNW